LISVRFGQIWVKIIARRKKIEENSGGRVVGGGGGGFSEIPSE